MKKVGYYNGKIGPLEEIQMPITDRAAYFGDGCYDATTYYNNNIFAFEEHLDRFYNSCRLLEIDFPLSRQELKKEIQAVVDANEEDHGMVYWQTSRGTGVRNHVFPKNAKANLMIFSVPAELVDQKTNFKLITLEDTRFLHCNIKTLNLIPSVIANQRAAEAGCDEVVFHRGERVTECAHSNLLIIKDGVLWSSPRDNLILPGITLKHLLELAEENGIPTREEAYTLDDVWNADEVIVSSSICFGIRTTEINGKSVGGKDEATLRKLQEAYMNKYWADVAERHY